MSPKFGSPTSSTFMYFRSLLVFPRSKVAVIAVPVGSAIPVFWKITAWLTGWPAGCGTRRNWNAPFVTFDSM